MAYELGKAVSAAVAPFLGVDAKQILKVTVEADRVEIQYGVRTLSEGAVRRLAIVDPETSTVLYDHKIGDIG